MVHSVKTLDLNACSHGYQNVSSGIMLGRFDVEVEVPAPMHLLEPRRLLSDEGLRGTMRFTWNILCDRESRERVLVIRKVFQRYQSNLAAVMMICVKR